MLLKHKSAPIFFDLKRFFSDLRDGDPVEIFQNALNAADNHFNTRFHEGDEAHRLVHDRADFVDLMISYAWQRYDWDPHISLLAVGGYGRGELHPHSDIDILLLTVSDNTQRYQSSIEQFLAFLWDINLHISHSVRSIQQCVDAAIDDISIATNLMETRLVCGSAEMLTQLMRSTGPEHIWTSANFYRGKLEEQRERYHKHDDTEYNLEPNIKEAPGGLRDIQLINWTAKRHFGAQRRSQLVQNAFLLEEEYGRLYIDEEFLWRVRYGLHLIAGRAEERLLFDYQRSLAKMFGYIDSNGKLGVEKFMQRYYRTVLSIRGLTDVLHQHLDEAIYRGNKTQINKVVNERFILRDNLLDTATDTTFDNHPSALLEVFVILGENDSIEGIRASAIRQIRHSVALIDTEFRADPANRRLFMRLMRAPYMLSLQLNRMNRYGILGKYLPEFGNIVGQTQHDLFHIYPVDVHTLQVIKNIRRLARPDVAKQFPLPSHLFKNLAKPELIIIAALFHDIAKGRGGDHSVLGARDIGQFARRHSLHRDEVALLVWLVKNHLLMSSVSQREDISDPEVIHRFASLVGDTMHLDYLYVLTVGDINATNPNLWTEWKGSLMQSLYVETKRALSRGLGAPVHKSRWSKNAKSVIFKRLKERQIERRHAVKIWGDIGDEFFLRETIDDIVRYTEAIHQHRAGNQKNLEPVILSRDIGVEIPIVTQIFVYSKDQDNILAVTAAVLDKLNLNIQDARLHTNSDEDTFDVFYVLDSNGEPVGRDSRLSRRLEKTLRLGLLSPDKVDFNTQRRTPRQLKSFNTKTTAKFSIDAETNATMLEVMTPDRPGLLARMANIFFRFNLRLLTAKISTLGERVEDIFYLTDEFKQPVCDADFCQLVETTICRELDSCND